MTPKEKAKELVKKMYGNIFDGGRFEDAEESLYKAKQCALIAVDEILGAIKEIFETLDTIEEKKYWQEVKQELCKH